LGLIVGIDTGGTFTDLVALDADEGRVVTLKTSSTPGEPGRAILNALGEAEIGGGGIDALTHGTTVGTNALIERTGCRVAFLTTKGFEDTPYIQRINRKVLYDLQWQKPEPLVATRRLCLGIDERLDARGETVKAVDEEEVRALCRAIRDAGAEAAAVCLLFSYVNTEHEERVKSIVRDELDGFPLGMTRPWTVMKSNGGAMLAEAAAESPIQTVMSGPAGGMIASERLARALGESDVITLDMGGTSADVGIIVGGQQRHTTEYEIEWGLPAAVPLIDVKSIGAGGGSIGWIDTGGFLRVGPRSAGAEPGPACYGRGGREPTVTDANVLLGRLDPGYFLGGRMLLEPALAEGPLGELAAGLGMERLELAASIVEIANENMASAIKMVSLERGYDPRRFALLAFGGAGPLHGAAIARTLGIPKLIVPPHPGVFSALGLLLADIRVDKLWTQAFRSTEIDAALVERQFRRIAERAVGELRQEGFRGEPELRRAITMRYYGQNYEHEIEVPAGTLDDRLLQACLDRFERLHAERYGYAIEGEVIELLSFKVTAVGRRPEPPLRPGREASGRARSEREIYFRGHGFLSAPVVHRLDLGAGETIEGPAVIEEEGSTTLVEPAMSVERTPDGSLVISTEVAT
jgi:N-methylhydantoinase A